MLVRAVHRAGDHKGPAYDRPKLRIMYIMLNTIFPEARRRRRGTPQIAVAARVSDSAQAEPGVDPPRIVEIDVRPRDLDTVTGF